MTAAPALGQLAERVRGAYARIRAVGRREIWITLRPEEDLLAEAQKKIEAAGGKFFFDLGHEEKENFERKFKDPDGVIFDISKTGWQGTR